MHRTRVASHLFHLKGSVPFIPFILQALTLKELPIYLEDIAIAREAYEKRRALAASKR